MAAVLVILGIFGIMILSNIWRGYVVSVLWGWFAVPLGLPSVDIAWAIGISLTVGLLTYQYNGKNTKTEDDFGHALAFATIFPAFILMIGWIVHGFM